MPEPDEQKIKEVIPEGEASPEPVGSEAGDNFFSGTGAYAEPRVSVPLYLGEEPFFSHLDAGVIDPAIGADDIPHDGAGEPGSVPDDPGRAHTENAAKDPFPVEDGNVVGVKVRSAGQVFFYDAGKEPLKVGSKVIIEQEHGPAMAEVVVVLSTESVSRPKKLSLEGRIESMATAKDIAKGTENNLLAAEAAAFCKTCIRQRELDMKLVEVEVLHDRSKIIFYFTAPTRIDFRELVKDLVRNYRTRIELRQVGVRHETQMIGGIGNCGSVCCCHRFLRKFAPVTIKMAKEQNLFLNPAKLSGMCGRLLCCLSYEQGNYEHFNKRAPKAGKKYTTSKGMLKVLRTNMFKQTIVCLGEANEELEFSLEDWELLKPGKMEAHGEHRHESDDDVPSGPEMPWLDERQMGADLDTSLDDLARDDEFEPQPGPSRGRGQDSYAGQRRDQRHDPRPEARSGQGRYKKRRDSDDTGGGWQSGQNKPESQRAQGNADRPRFKKPRGPRPQGAPRTDGTERR